MTIDFSSQDSEFRSQNKAYGVLRGPSAVSGQLSVAPKSHGSTASRPTVQRSEGIVEWREYQKPIIEDHSTGIVVLHWARQIGKSFVLAGWAVERLMTRHGGLVTVLSDSRENGAEFVAKCAEICRLTHTKCQTRDRSASAAYKDLRMEVRVRVHGKWGRIKVLAANPRTARGFSGDLILDEFAFHEDAEAIWAAAEPILASNPDFLCRIASTGNGRHNLFYRMVHCPADSETAADEDTEGDGMLTADERGFTQMGDGLLATDETRSEHGEAQGKDILTTESLQTATATTADENTEGNGILTTNGTGWTRMGEGEINRIERKESDAVGEIPAAREYARPTGFFRSREGMMVSRVSRTMAWLMGVKVFDAVTRRPISPEEARAQALDKRAYDQNYECAFADENLSLLSHELISAAEDDEVGLICEQDWSASALARMREAKGDLFVGFDVGRKVDLSVITVLEKAGSTFYARGILRIQDMRLPEQELRLGEVCRMPRFRSAAIDMTGLGLGLYEYARKSFGSRIRGINFASVVPVTSAIEEEGRKRETARVTETMAVELLRCYEDRRMRHPRDGRLRDDLRKPEKVTSPGGRVSISATRDAGGHADHFWSLALAVEAAKGNSGHTVLQTIPRPKRYLL